MIPLRLKTTVSPAGEPFVVRLRTTAIATSDCVVQSDALLKCIDGNAAIFETYRGEVGISGIDPDVADGDVVLVVPRQSMVHRLIRARSEHNTFLITERCDQLCAMCSQPPKPQHIDLFSQFETAALLAPRNSIIGLSGGEPTLFKEQLFGLLGRVLSDRPDLTFHVLTNGQHFEADDQEPLNSFGPDRVLWGIPLYSPLPWQHDELVGKPGAHERLMASMAVLAMAGASIELRTVLMKPNVPVLPLLANHITRHLPFVSVWAIMQLESIGYGRKNWDALFFDNSDDFGMIGRALDIVHGRGMEAKLYNFPMCSVPEPYRRYAPSTISDWKRKYLRSCCDCTLRERCGGFFEWYSESRGFKRVGL